MSAWATHSGCHRVSLDCAATIGMMATIKVTMRCLPWRHMTFVKGHHWFVRLHLVVSTVFHWFGRLHLVGRDGYGEMPVLATHGVCHRVSLDCAATIGMMATMTAKCHLG